MSAPLHLGLNGLFLGQPSTGSGRYLLQLIDWLPSVAPEMRIAVLRGGPSPFDGRSENLAKLYLEQIGLPRAARQQEVDVLHYPYFAAPLFPTTPTVVTVHDLIPLLLPEYRRSWSVRAYMWLVSQAARRADYLITDSTASQDDLLRVLRVSPERVAVIPLAPSGDYRPLSDRAQIEAIRHRYKLRDDYVIYLGSYERRKNVEALLRAFARARHELGFRARLALAGRVALPGPLFPDVRGLARELGLEDAVAWLGAISDEDANALYNGALAFIFPSRYEGFGLPPLEAMAAGAPVLCAKASSLPEVVGDAAILFAPDDVASLAHALVRVASDAELRGRLREAGLRQAARFTWERTARETAAVYREVAARHGVRGTADERG